MIDWDKFKRVPLGTRVRGNETLAAEVSIIRERIGKEGVLTGHAFEFAGGAGYANACVVYFFDSPQDWQFIPTQLDYLIDGRWLSYDELMA